MQTKADKIMDAIIDEMNRWEYKVEDIHLMKYDEFRQLEPYLDRCLRGDHLDLLNESSYSEKYNVTLSGNITHIISDIRYYYMYTHNSSWKELDSDISFEPNNYYEMTKSGYPRQIHEERFFKLFSMPNHAIIKVYIDAKHNVMIDKIAAT